MMKVSDALQFLDKLAAKTVKKSALDDELLVIEWTPNGAVMLHLDVSSSPRIKRVLRIELDASMTENEKRNAHLQFLEGWGQKRYPKTVLCWSDGVTFRQLSIPDMPEEDLLKALAWDLKKKYFFNSEESLLGYKEVMTVEGEEAPEKLYNVFYTERKTALPRLDFAAGLGLEIQALVPGAAALARLVSAIGAEPQKDTIVCELFDGAAHILVVREDRNMLVRHVVLSGIEGPWTDEMLGRVAEEIRKTVDYYEAQKYSRPVGKVFFIGARCEPTRVLDFMTPKLNIPVACPGLEGFLSGSLDENDKNLVLSHAGLFATALGAALMRDDTLNLVPEDIKTRNRQKKLSRWLSLGLVSFSLFLAFGLAVTAVQTEWVKKRLEVLEKESAEMAVKRGVFEGILAREKVRRAALQGDVPVPSLLKELSLRTPTVIALRQVQYSRQDGSLTVLGDAADLKHEGARSVTQFSTNLSESLFFKSALVSSTQPDEPNKTVQFEVGAVVKGLT